MAKTAKGAGSGAIGKVAIIYGEVKAISPDGTVRILGPNSLVFADDQIITGSDGSVSLILDGTPPIHLDLGRMSQLVLDEDVYGGAGTAADAAAEADKVQQALLAGDQPIEPEAPAAGGEANAGGGHPVVNYSLTGAEVTPDSGAETRGIGFGPLEVTEGDTVPIGGDDIGAVDDEGINECWIRGNLGGDESDHPTNDAFIVGKLSYNFGADGPHPTEPFAWSMTGLPEMGITSHGHTLLYEVVDGGTTLNAYYIIECGYPNGGDFKAAVSQEISFEPMEFRVDVFSLELTNIDTGAYTFTLFKPLDHPIAETEDDINYIFGYGLKDGDNSTGSGVLRMTVDDDTPVMGCRDENRTVDEDDINNCQSDGNYPNDGAWTDGSFTGNPWYGHDHGPANIWGSLMGVVAFGADGPADNPWTCGPDGFSFAEGEDALCSLYDQNLSSKGEMLSYKIECNTLIGYVGVDGEPSETDSIGDFRTQIPQDRVVFTLELDGNGFYKFSLYDQLDHENPCVDEVEDKMAVDGGDNGLDTIPIDFSGVIVATDYDGDSVTLEDGRFVINITDDEPKQTGCLPEIGIVEEEALPDGNQEIKDHIFDPWLFPIPDTAIAEGTLAWQVSVGADEPVTFSMSGVTCGLPQLTSNGEDISYDVIDNVLYAYVPCEKPEDNGDGAESLKTLEPSIPVEGRLIFTLELQENGDYKFTLVDQIDHDDCGEDSLCIDFSSMIVATDFDGDSITLNQDFFIKVIDDMPVSSYASATLDDEGQTGGIPGGPGDVPFEVVQVAGILPPTFGADQPGTIDFAAMDGKTGKVGIETVTYDWDAENDILTATGPRGVLFEVEVTDPATGAYRVSQYDNVLHTDPSQVTVNTGNTNSSGWTSDGAVRVTVYVPGDSKASINENSNESGSGKAFGITSTVDGDGADRFNEINYLGAGSSEVMIFTLQGDRIATSASVDINMFYAQEGGVGNEVGYYELWNDGVQVQGPTQFSATSVGDDGNFQLLINGPESGFDQIRFGASAGSSQGAGAADSSDYNIKQVVFDQSYENDAVVKLTYTLTDADNDTENGRLTLTFDDDMPKAYNIEKSSATSSDVDTNLLITLDISGSMSDASGIPGYTRLDAAKEAIEQLLDAYDAKGDIMVKLIAFSTDAYEAGTLDTQWLTVGEAKTALAALSPTNLTNYDAGLQAAMDAFTDDGKIPDGQNVAYFLSDGGPNVDGGITSDGSGNNVSISEWTTFLETNDIVSFALGMGTGVSASALNPIAYNGVAGADTNAIIVNDFGDLSQTLIGTINVLPVHGNLLTDSDPDDGGFGADGGHVYSIKGAEGLDSSSSEANDGYDLKVNGEFGFLEVNSNTGEYLYTPTETPATDAVDKFTYTLIDGDGDIANADLSILIDVPNNEPT